MTSGKDFRFAFCVTQYAINDLSGAAKTVQLTLFKDSKKNGFEELKIQRMYEGEFADYFNLTTEDPYSSAPAQFCFRPEDDQSIPIGGSY